MSKTQRTLEFDLHFDVTAFASGVQNNFRTIWEFMQEQANDIENLRKKVENMESHKNNVYHDGISKNDSQQVSLVYSDKSCKSLKINPENGVEENGAYLGKNADNQRSEQKVLHQNSNINEDKAQGITIEGQKSYAKQSLGETLEGTKYQSNQNLSLIENKIFELNERLEKLQLSSIKQNGNLNRKLTHIQSEIDKNFDASNRKQKQYKKLQHEVSNFRTDLASYKMKKQSQLMRMSGKAGQTKGESSDYLLARIQELALHAQQTVTKEQFQIFQNQVNNQMNKMMKKMNETVSANQFNEIIEILTKQIKKRRHNNVMVEEKKEDEGKQKDNNNDDEDSDDDSIQTILKIREIEKKLSNLHQLIIQEKQLRKEGEKNFSHRIFEQGKEISDLKAQENKNQYKITQHQQFIKDMNSSYNTKFKEIEQQIIQTQEGIQKLNNQMKFYNFTGSSQTAASVVNGSSGSLTVQSGKIAGMEADINTLKKKVNKYSMKIQGLKEQMTTFKDFIIRQVDGLKMLMDKKSDWEGIKKGFNYFQDRLKEVIESIMNLQASIQAEEKEDNTTTAAKKGWTCLCCDKDIKKFEGKLSEAKFASIFPARYDSPRIGGYYKRKDSEKEYKQLFLPKGNGRKLTHNIGALNESKGEI